MSDLRITATIREDAQGVPYPSDSDLRLLVTRALGEHDLLVDQVTIESVALPPLSDQAIVDEIRAAGRVEYREADDGTDLTRIQNDHEAVEAGQTALDTATDYPHGHDAEGNRLDHVWGQTHELPERAEDETYDEWVSRAVHEAVGAASVAWGGSPRGVFDEAAARSIAQALIGLVTAGQGTQPGTQ